MGEGSVEKGYFSSTCLSCGYELQGTICPAFELEPSWRIRIRWSAAPPTMKGAYLLRKLIPGLAGMSIQQVQAHFGRSSEWSTRGLSTESMQQYRTTAESFGFEVEVEDEGKRWREAQRPSAGSQASLHGVRFAPSFHEEGFILVSFGKARDSISIVREKGTETVDIPTERGVRFIEEVTALDPLSIPDERDIGLDGIRLECFSHLEAGTRKFTTWSPNSQRYPRQYGFVQAVYQLAMDLAREPATVEFLEQLFGYLSAGLPLKVFEETPRRFRLFGRLSSYEGPPLEELFASIPPDEPVLMDLTGFESMGTILHPLFARFHARPGRTAWWVNTPASRHLTEAGIPAACLHTDRESALAALEMT